MGKQTVQRVWKPVSAVVVCSLLLAGLALVFVGCGSADEGVDASGAATDGETTVSTVADMSATTVVTGLERPTTVVTSTSPPEKPAGGSGGTGSSSSNGGRSVVGGKSTEEYESSIPELKNRTASEPNNLDALQELAIAYYQTKKFAEAAATYEAMLAVRDDPMTRNNYANVLRDWGKTAEAKAEYGKAIAASPSLVVAYINLASVWVGEGDVGEAVKVLDRGIGATSGEDKTRLESYKATLTKEKEE